MEQDPPRQVQDLPTLEMLLGRRLHISPSQLEKYYTCRYGYFLQYVLGLKPRRRAELSADQSGAPVAMPSSLPFPPDSSVLPDHSVLPS